MAYKVALSYGHGSDTWEKTHGKGVVVGGTVYEEHTHNATVGEKVKNILIAHGINVLVLQPPFGTDVALKTRTDKANSWGANLYYSIHSNSAAPTVKGYTGFYWSTSEAGKRIAGIYTKYIKALGWPLYHNGAFPSVEGTWNDFHELRESKMPAILTENGFMTNGEDFSRIFLNEADAHNKEARAHAKTILEYFGKPYDPVKGGEKSAPKPAPEPSVVYKVQAGAFKDRANAERLSYQLGQAGFSNFIVSESNLLKVQCGAFRKKENAAALVSKLKTAKFTATIITD